MNIPDSGDLTTDILPAFRDRLNQMLRRGSFAHINGNGELLDELTLERLQVFPNGSWGPTLSAWAHPCGGFFNLSVTPNDAVEYQLYSRIHYGFKARSLAISAVAALEPHKISRFYFIGQ